MATVTQKDAVLKISLNDGVNPVLEFACQVQDAEFTQPSQGEGDTVPVACGGDPVKTPADSQTDGSITGTVFKDTSATGITRLLAKAVAAPGTTFDYEYTENEGTDEEFKFTGKATAPAFGIPFQPSQFGTHPLSLTVITATLADPYTP